MVEKVHIESDYVTETGTTPAVARRETESTAGDVDELVRQATSAPTGSEVAGTPLEERRPHILKLRIVVPRGPT
jgi:hypothetical protein